MSSDESGLSGLQFDRAEPVESAALSCVSCRTPIAGVYYALNGQPLCPSCADLQRPQLQEPSTTDYLRAGLCGAGAALAGTALYFAILALSGYEIGWIALAVGWGVGKAVQKGSRGIGGRKLQIMAVVLTYFSIAGSYVPLIVKHAIENPPGQKQTASDGRTGDPATSDGAPTSRAPRPATTDTDGGSVTLSAFLIGILVLFGYCLALPFLQGFSSIIGLFIIFIGMFEAWKLNRRVPLTLDGPMDAPRPLAADQ